MNSLIADPEDDGQRLDVFLAAHLPERSRGELQRDIEAGRATIGGAIAFKPKKPVRAGQEISLNEEGRLDKPVPEAIPLEILYEDDSLLVVNKPVGMIVHPNKPEETGTLVQAVLAHAPKVGEALYDPESPVSKLRPGIVHRLDKDTSGVIVVAKTREALLNLAGQFQRHRVEKEYLTLVEGEVGEPRRIETRMKRTDAKDKNLMGVAEEGREAITFVTPKSHYAMPNGRTATLLACAIQTGRTHQIRVHCKHIGHPVLGDQLYYSKISKDSSKRLGIQRQLLHAARLTITHPETGERITFQAPLPADFQSVLTALTSL